MKDRLYMLKSLILSYHLLVIENCEKEEVKEKSKELKEMADRFIDDLPNYIPLGPFC